MALGNFISEMKRRHVIRAAAAYAAVFFVLIEVVATSKGASQGHEVPKRTRCRLRIVC